MARPAGTFVSTLRKILLLALAAIVLALGGLFLFGRAGLESDKPRYETTETPAAQGVTLVLVTHHIEEIVPEIDRVVVLQQGRILADGPRAQVLDGALLSAAFGGPVRVWQERDPHGDLHYLAAPGD